MIKWHKINLPSKWICSSMCNFWGRFKLFSNAFHFQYGWLGLYGVMAIQSSTTALDLNAQALNNQLIWNFNPVRDVVWFFIVLNSLISLKDCTNQIPNSFRLSHCIKLIAYCFLGLYRFLHKLVATETRSFTNSSRHEDWTRSNERSITQVGLLHFTSNYVGHIE